MILDDRGERPGAMFADWELIGVPLRVTVGDRGLKEGMVELTVRRGLATDKVPVGHRRGRGGAAARSASDRGPMASTADELGAAVVRSRRPAHCWRCWR